LGISAFPSVLGKKKKRKRKKKRIAITKQVSEHQKSDMKTKEIQRG